MDPNNPREAWKRFQNVLSRVQQKSGRGGGAPKGALGGGAALLMLAGAAFAFNNAIFNGSSASFTVEISVNGGI